MRPIPTTPRFLLPALALGVMFIVSGCASLQNLDLGSVRPAPGLDETTVTAGIKEALRIGAERTVGSVSAVDGFLGNELIRIAAPPQLDSVTSTLRDVGLGMVVDDLEEGMNRAAEAAAGEALSVLWEAVRTMTVADAFGILDGGETAATTYFRDRTGAELRSRFQPIVRTSMNEVGVARLYDRLVDVYTNLPLTGAPEAVSLDDYVTDRALDGLFSTLAGEETRIRQDPLARTTELLRRVFGERRAP